MCELLFSLPTKSANYCYENFSCLVVWQLTNDKMNTINCQNVFNVWKIYMEKSNPLFEKLNSYSFSLNEAQRTIWVANCMKKKTHSIVSFASGDNYMTTSKHLHSIQYSIWWDRQFFLNEECYHFLAARNILLDETERLF